MAEDAREAARRRLAQRAQAREQRVGSAASNEAREAARQRLAARAAGRGGSGGGGGKGIWGQIGDVVSGLPSGIVGMGRDLVTDLNSTVEDEILNPLPFVNIGGKRQGESQREYEQRRYPFMRETVDSLSRTGGRVTQGVASLAPGGLAPTETDYAEAIRQSGIVGTVLEDVGNAALVGGLATRGVAAGAGSAARRAATTGSVARAERLARIADRADDIARGANEVDAAPVKALTVPFTGMRIAGRQVPGINAGVRAAVPKIADTRAGRAMVERAQAAMKAQGWDKATRESRAQLRDRYIIPAVQERQLGGRKHELAIKKAERYLNDRDAQHANILLHTGQGPLVRAALKLTGEEQHDFIRDTWDFDPPSIKTLRLVDEYEAGRLSPENREAMDASWQVIDQLSRAHEEARLAGVGHVGEAMSPEQLLDEPMPSAIENVTYKRRQAIENIRKELEGDPDRDMPGLRAEARAARARVPEVNLAEQVSERAVARVQRAAALEGEGALARSTAARLRQGEATAADDVARMTERQLESPVPRDLEGVTGTVERGAVRADRAGARAARAEADAAKARERIFTTAGQKAADQVVEDGGLFSPENRARLRPEDVTPENVRPELERVDRDLRGAAARGSELARADLLTTFDTAKLAHKPPQRLARKGVERMEGNMHVDDAGAEWDWFRQLPGEEQARIRKNWMAREGEAGSTPDQIQASWAARRGDDALAGGIEAAMQDFVRQTREIDALDRLAKGEGTAADLDLVAYRVEQGVAPGVRLDLEEAAGSLTEMPAGRKPGPKQRMAQRAERFAEFMRERLAREDLGPEPPVSRTDAPAGWQMTEAEFSAEVMSLSETVAAAARRLDEAADEWAEMTPAETAAYNRLNELLPPEWDAGPLADSHRAMVDAAQRHGYEVPEGALPPPVLSPEDVRAAAGTDAVRQAEADALDTLEGDLALESVAKARGEKVPTEAMGFPHLTAGQKAIYREARARAKKVGAEEALAEARRRLVERVDAAGQRAGRRVGRSEGEARALGREAGRLERRAETVNRRLGPGIKNITDAERARLAGDPSIPAGEEVLGRFRPPMKDAARADLERSMAKPVRAGERRGRAEQKARDLERSLRSKERRLEWLETKLAEQEQHLASGPLLFGKDQVVPGKYKVPLLTARNARESLTRMAAELEEITGDPSSGQHLLALADELPDSMAALQAQGVFPEYLVGGPETRTQAGVRTPGRREHLPGRFKVASEHAKTHGRVPKSYRAVGRSYVEVFSRAVENTTAKKIEVELGRTGASVLDDVIATLDEATPGDAQALADLTALKERGGLPLAKEMEARGLSAWDPTNPSGGRVADDAVTAETVFLPTPLVTEFAKYFKKAGTGPLRTMIDLPVRGWKHMVLAMSPSWHVGNIIGNTLLASIGAGLSPLEIARFGKEALRMLREERVTGEVNFPPRLYGAGMSGEMLRFFADRADEAPLSRLGNRLEGSAPGKVRSALAHPIQTSYNLNSFIDDWGRSTVYLAKKARGLNDEAAVRESLKAMGDFGRMAPWERDIVRRFFPFYAWTRHVTQLAYHLAVEHPYRVAWTLHLTELHRMEQEEGLPGFLEGAFKVGPGRYVSTGLMNPYGTVADNPLSPQSLGRGLTPLAKVPLAYTTGIDLGRHREMTRPPGTYPLDERGNRRFGPLDLGQLTHVLAQQTPLTRALQATTQDPVIRYDTGDPMKVGGRELPLEGTSIFGLDLTARQGQIARQFIPFLPMAYDNAGTTARTLKKRQAAEKARRRYEQ